MSEKENTEPTRHPSAMVESFGRLQGWVAGSLTRHIHLEESAVEELRSLAARGTIVYVVRNRSLLDYFLINWILLREGLPLARFANGVSSTLFGSLWTIARGLLRAPSRWRARRPGPTGKMPDGTVVGDLVASDQPLLVFLRARMPWMWGTRRSKLAAARPGRHYLREIVHRAWDLDRPVFVVPVSLFRGRVFRHRVNRIQALAYSVHDAPGDLKKLVTYGLNAEDLLLTVGRVVHLNQFIVGRRALGESRVALGLTNHLQRELAQEERAVWGPLLLPREVLAERVFEGAEMREAVTRVAAERRAPESKVWREARGYFREIAANFHGLPFAIAEIIFRAVWKRAFSGVEVRGLERVVERIKEHPVVLVPCHRSHFDYLVLSYIFRENFLSPPHIAAGINLAFFPVASLLRGAGAFFIRRTFDNNELYKLVFRRYLSNLIREGYTLEFFIEGGRSRTGKILTPKLGMLGMVVDAFLKGVRSDLYLVPISIHYGRIAEENAYREELAGGVKQRETFSALLKARSVLRQRHGTVYVSFAEPLSLRETLGDRFARFASPDPAVAEERRRFVQKLGFRILRDVNEVAVVGATSLSATVLLSSPNSTVRIEEFAAASRVLAELLRWRRAAFTPSLERNLGPRNFEEIIGFLASSGLVEVARDADGRSLRVPRERRAVLDFYKNNTIHFFLLPSLVAHAQLHGRAGDELREDVWWWLDLFRWEFALPERDSVAQEVSRLLDYFRAHGASFGPGARPVPLVLATAGILQGFREAYWVATRAIVQLGPEEKVQEPELVERMRKLFDAALLLGDVAKLEAGSNITFGNAISRLVEVGVLRRDSTTGPKDRGLRRGPRFEEIAILEARLAAARPSGGKSSAKRAATLPFPSREGRGDGGPSMEPGVPDGNHGSVRVDNPGGLH